MGRWKKQTQILCKVCQSRFKPNADSRFSKTHVSKRPYYLRNLKKVDKSDLQKHKYKYKLHYTYREFQIDFFRMDLNSLSKNASSLRFSKFDQNVMGLCLSYKVNLELSLRKTAHALHAIHGIKISHQQVAN